MMAKLMYSSILLLVLILLPSCYPKHTIIAVLPLNNELTELPTLSWEKGWEMVPGAQVAIERLNQYYDITPEYQLELEVINSGKCTKEYNEEPVIDFLNLTEHRNFSQVGVIGLFCSSSSEQILLNIAERISLNLIVVSSSVSITRFSVSNAQTLKNNSYHILPSAEIFIDAFSSLIVHLGQNRIAVVTQSTDSYFFRVAEALYDKATTSNAYRVRPFIQLHIDLTAESVFQELEQFSSNIIFLSANIDKSIDILCTAKRLGFTWPHYAWITHSILLDDFIKAQHIAKCNIYEALEGVLLLQHQLSPAYATHSSYSEDYNKKLSDLSTEMGITLRPNPYAVVLYNSVWVYAIHVYTQMSNNSPDSIKNNHYAQKTVEFSSTKRAKIEVCQVKNRSSIYEGYYDPIWKNITFTGALLNGPIPSDNHEIITDRASLIYTSIISAVVLVCTILVTVVLILYIYYFKEPEIKSTSVSLSLLMFCGCYIILLYLLLAIIYTQSLVPSSSLFNICTAIVWLSVTGISLPLILATLLVKMLRVFHIFNLYGKISKMCSDSAILVYVLLLISPCIIILIFWTAVDTYTARTIATEHPRFTEVEQRCTCKYLLLWIGLLIVNFLILLVVLLVVAVKTRKIRQAHFKDTKKVNAFLFVLVMVIIIPLANWMIFRTIGAKKGYSDISIHLAHIIIVVGCQGFLFVPKVLPPLMRSVSKRYQLKMNSSTNTSKTQTSTVTLTN